MVTRPRSEPFPSELLAYLTLRELRGKFKRSTLGWLWSIINPAAMIAVYSIVFGVFLKLDPPKGRPDGLQVYALYLMCALLPWTFVSNALGGAVGCIVANEGLVKKVYFQRWVLPASTVGAWFASFGVEMVVLAVILLVAGNMVLPWVPLVVVLMGLQAGFLLGLGLMLSAANAYFRDIQHFLAIFMNIWFYLTPILYQPELIPEVAEVQGIEVRLRSMLALNPMSIFVRAYRDMLYHLRMPTLATWAVLVVITAVSLLLGAAVFRKLEPNLAEEI